MNNNIGLHYGYWLKNWDGNIVKIVEKVSKLGFSAIEIDADVLLNKSDKKRNKISKKIDENHLNLNVCIGMDSKYDVSSKDRIIRRRGIKHVKKIIKMLNLMGSNTLSGVCYGEWNPDYNKAKDKNEYIKRSIESIDEIVNFAAENNVNYNLEPVNRYEQFMLNTCKEALHFIEKINNKNLNILLDTYHMNIEENSLSEAILNAGDNLGHFHIGENNRKPPGECSIIDWERVFDTLDEIDYKGDIVMEPFINYNGEIGYDTRLWRDMNRQEETLEERIKSSLKFIERKMKKGDNC